MTFKKKHFRKSCQKTVGNLKKAWKKVTHQQMKIQEVKAAALKRKKKRQNCYWSV